MKNITPTLAFFDLFNYPLTAWELWRFNQSKMPYTQILAELEEAALPEQNGFYFLPGREALVITRHNRYNIADKKFKRSRRAAWWLSRLPWVRFVALVNLIGAHNLRSEGDLDFLIVTKKNRLWLSRFIITSWLKIFNLRPTDKKSQDTICLSFWLDEDHLDFSNFRLADDWYFRYWLAGLAPLYDRQNIYDKIIATNSWLKNELPNWQPAKIASRHVLNSKQAKEDSPLERGGRRPGCVIAKKIFNKLENLAKNFQWKIMPENLKNLANQDTRVVINEGVIKMHPLDRRVEFTEKHQERLRSL